MAQKKKSKLRSVDPLIHTGAKRRNIPTAEFQSVLPDDKTTSSRMAYERRNRDLDPQLVWQGKDEQDTSDLIVQAPPLYIQEKVHPKVLIDDLLRQTKQRKDEEINETPDMFADFNGLPDAAAKTEFYQHDANWSNRMILGDSLQVMASLVAHEGLSGKVQCIYIDPPYGIKFNSNFQWSTTSQDVRDGKAEHITREPEQVKAFRDTWRNGIHSYLAYLHDRLTVARDLLSESGSIFVQIGEQNVHRVRSLMDEIFGEDNFVSLITYRTSSGTTQKNSVKRISDYIVWYCKNKNAMKFRRLLQKKQIDTNLYKQLELKGNLYRRPMTKEERDDPSKCPDMARPYMGLPVYSMASGNNEPRTMFGSPWRIPAMRSWRFSSDGFTRLYRASRISPHKNSLSTVYYYDDYPAVEITNSWIDTGPVMDKNYVVETSIKPISRCILMTTDPGDLVLDPTCGSGTTAYVAEQWGRRWITIDTSRIALALARARLMGASYPWYLLTDSQEGQRKEAELRGQVPPDTVTHSNIRLGFVYERVPHISLKSIASNQEIDSIWEEFQEQLESLRQSLNQTLKKDWEEWNIPREADESWPSDAASIHQSWWDTRNRRQNKIDTSIKAKAEFEYLYDEPYIDNSRRRVAGPFTVESLSPHSVLAVDENDELFSENPERQRKESEARNFTQMILDNLKTAGVQQVHKDDHIVFTNLTQWPGRYIHASGIYENNENTTRRAAIFIGPEFGTVSRPDLAAAVREAAEHHFDILIACAFNYDAHAADFEGLKIPVLKARMNADLHMADNLSNTGKGNLFVVFGEPDISIEDGDETETVRVKLNGMDVYHPNTGEVRSDDIKSIACWFIDTDYDEESFFVRHAYFLGAKDPYKALNTSLKAEIDDDAWSTLYSDVSRPFAKPKSGRIAVKVINYLGDEVMKVYRVQ